MKPFVYYHAVKKAAHDAKIAALKKDYRLVSLSIYGFTTNPSFAAVWARRPPGNPGPTQWFSPLLEEQYVMAYANDLIAYGYEPTIIASCGSGKASDPFRFCLVAELVAWKMVPLVYNYLLHETFDSLNGWHLNHKTHVLRWATVYGQEPSVTGSH